MKVERHPKDVLYTKIAGIISSIVWGLLFLMSFLSTFVLSRVHGLKSVLFAFISGALFDGMLFVFFFLAVFIATAALITHIRGNGVKAGQKQFPEINKIAGEAAKKLGLTAVPEIYIIQNGGVINAFASRLFFRKKNCITLYSDIIRPLYDQKDLQSIKMILSHEMGHIIEGHISIAYHIFLLPARIIPVFGLALSRAWELTCDRYGVSGCDKPGEAEKGMAILACGSRLYQGLDRDAYIEQYKEEHDFWLSMAGVLNLTHPYTSERIIGMRKFLSRQAS